MPIGESGVLLLGKRSFFEFSGFYVAATFVKKKIPLLILLVVVRIVVGRIEIKRINSVLFLFFILWNLDKSIV